MVTTVDTHDEARLLEAIKRAYDLTAHGQSPTEAVAKVASEMRLTPGRIEMVCRAYNVGKQASQRLHSKSANEQFAAFPLADAQMAIQSVYGQPAAPTVKAAALDPDYKRGPYWLERKPKQIKAAAKKVEPKPVEKSAKERYDERVDKGRQMAEYSRQASAYADQLRTKVAHLVGYFQQAARDRYSFAQVECGVQAYMPKEAQQVLTLVRNQGHITEKRASAGMVLERPLALDIEPFTDIQACLDLRAKSLAAKEAAAQLRHELYPPKQADYVAPGFSLLEVPKDLLGRPKSAGMAGPLAVGMASNALSRSIGNAKTRGELIDDAALELGDPQHMNELRKIDANTMLTSMLTDPDDPISGHDVDKVLQAYNEVSRMAPRVAEQPGALRAALQRRLQGNIQPFENKELVDTEKVMRESYNPERREAPTAAIN